jgi:hypothetical protein
LSRMYTTRVVVDVEFCLFCAVEETCLGCLDERIACGGGGVTETGT